MFWKLLSGFFIFILLLSWGVPFCIKKVLHREGLALDVSSWQLNLKDRSIVINELKLLSLQHLDYVLLPQIKYNFSTRSLIINKPLLGLFISDGSKNFWQEKYSKLFSSEQTTSNSKLNIEWLKEVVLEDVSLIIGNGREPRKINFDFQYYSKSNNYKNIFTHIIKAKASFQSGDSKLLQVTGTCGFEDFNFFSPTRFLTNISMKKDGESYDVSLEKRPLGRDVRLEVLVAQNNKEILNTSLLFEKKKFNLSMLRSYPVLPFLFKNYQNNTKNNSIFMGDRILCIGKVGDCFCQIDTDVTKPSKFFFNKIKITKQQQLFCKMNNFFCHGCPMMTGIVDPFVVLDPELIEKNQIVSQFLCPKKKWIIGLNQKNFLCGLDIGAHLLSNSSEVGQKNLLYDMFGSFSFDYQLSKIIFNKGVFNFLNGTIHCPLASVGLGDLNFFGKFSIDKLLVANETSVIESSGNIFFSGDARQKNILHGEIFLNRGYLQLRKLGMVSNQVNNIFSNQVLASKIFLCDVDLLIKTLAPVKFEFSGESFSLDIDLKLQGRINESCSAQALKAVGHIDAWANNFSCLGYKLNSLKARLDYKESCLQDPLVRIDLETRIKRYNLDFHLFGTLDDLVISSKSEPYLTEDQIISLLFTGMSDHAEGFQYLLATAVSQFGSSVKNEGAAKSLRFLKKVISPLPGLKVAPCVTDFESLKSPAASLLINVGDNLSASIVKELRHNDDLRLNFEYLVAENLVLRLNRSYDGLVNGFLELKYKF